MAGPTLRTALSLVLEDARPALEPVRARFDPASVEAGVPLHVTLLFPFVERSSISEAELEALFAVQWPLEFSLVHLAEFPGIVYAVPEPDDRLVALMRSVHAKFPEVPPYGGEVDGVTPHATLGRNVELREVGAVCASLLPIACRVDSVSLLAEREPDRWFELRRFRLGTS